MSPDILKKMRDMGLSLDQAIELLEAMATKAISAGARRQREYRDRQRITNDVTRDASGDATDVTEPPLPLALPPQTPLSHTPTPPDVTTRGRGEAGFARFWLAYPRKTAKGDARKAYDRAIRKLSADLNRDPEVVLIGGLERAKAAWVDAQFIPHPATWLNGERWDDEPETAARKAPHERPHHDAKYAARQDNLAAHERGADLAARFHGEP